MGCNHRLQPHVDWRWCIQCMLDFFYTCFCRNCPLNTLSDCKQNAVWKYKTEWYVNVNVAVLAPGTAPDPEQGLSILLLSVIVEEYWKCAHCFPCDCEGSAPTHTPTTHTSLRTPLTTTTTSTFSFLLPCWTGVQRAGLSEVRTALQMLGRGGGKKLLRISVSYLPQNGLFSSVFSPPSPADRFVWKRDKRGWFWFRNGAAPVSSAEEKLFFEDADLTERRYLCYLGFLNR